MTESATRTELAEDRASVAERNLADTQAKLGVAQNERDVAVKTAEAAEAGLTQAISERDDLARRNEELAREAGRQQGVNEALKDELQKKLQTPPQAPPDLTPITDKLSQIEQKLVKQPEHKVADVVIEKKLSGFWERFLWWLLFAVAVVLLSVLLFFNWGTVSAAVGSFFNSFVFHHQDKTQPPTDQTDLLGPPANDVEASFRNDCAAHHGRIYTAEEWNLQGKGPHLEAGQLYCDY